MMTVWYLKVESKAVIVVQKSAKKAVAIGVGLTRGTWWGGVRGDRLMKG